MSADKAQRDLICRLVAELVQYAPTRVPAILNRFQFRMADVTIRVTEKGRFWVEVHRWPWDPELVVEP